jgi:hypothetical protein
MRSVDLPVSLSLLVLGLALIGVVVGLVILGKRDDAVQDSITGLATIGAGLTGGLAGWFGRGVAHAKPPAEETDDASDD